MFRRKKQKRSLTEMILDRTVDPTKRAEVALVMGKSREVRYVPVLVEALHNDPEPSVRMNSAFALGELGVRAAKEPLLKAVQEDGSEWARGFCASALTNLDLDDYSDVEEVLIDVLDRETDPGARRHIVHSLGLIGSDRSEKILTSMLRNDLNPGVRADAAEALGTLMLTNTMEYIKNAAENDISAEVRRMAFEAQKKFEMKLLQ